MITSYTPLNIEPDPPTIDVTATLANIFGCRDADVDQLCQISDWAANVRQWLQVSDADGAYFELKQGLTDTAEGFVKWMVSYVREEER